MITKDEYQLWKDHPTTVKFHQYLIDYRDQLMNKWASGGFDETNNLMAIARAQQADEIVNLEDDAILEFYNSQKESE